MLTYQQHVSNRVDLSTWRHYREYMPSSLTRQELETWRGFRFMVEETSLGVSRALFSETGMSGGQFGILSVLQEAPSHSMRQQEVADAMRWDRTRLSHQLTRMQNRGWIVRKKSDGGMTLVSLTEAGQQELLHAAPTLGKIVKQKFFDRLSVLQLAALEEIRRALAMDKSTSELRPQPLEKTAVVNTLLPRKKAR